jgi:hypothetical protein
MPCIERAREATTMPKAISLLQLCTLSSALLVGGCGGGDADEIGKWVGNWNRTGTQSTTCGVASGTNQLSGVIIIIPGSMSGTIQSQSENCALLWDVKGDKATLRAGQTCTVSVNGFNATIMGTQGSATISGSTITGTESGSTNNGCSFTQQFTLTRM